MAASAPTKELADRCSDEVHRIVTRVALEEANGSPYKTYVTDESSERKMNGDATASPLWLCSGPLTPNEIQTLKELTAMNSTSFANIEGEILSNLVTFLQSHVRIASQQHLVDHAAQALAAHALSPSQAKTALIHWLEHHALHSLPILQLGLEAALIIVGIASTPDVDIRAINEEAIGSSIALARIHLIKNLLPAFNQTGHLSALVQPGTTNDAKNSSPVSKRQRTTMHTHLNPNHGESNVATADALKAVYKLVISTVEAYKALLEHLDALVRAKTSRLDDQQILMLTSCLMHALEFDAAIDPNAGFLCTTLQVHSMTILISCFRRYPSHRSTILQDLLVMLPKLPASKKSIRTFPVSYASVKHSDGMARWNYGIHASSSNNCVSLHSPHTIQVLTALIISLLLSTIERPAFVIENVSMKGDDPQTSDGDVINKVSNHQPNIGEAGGNLDSDKNGGDAVPRVYQTGLHTSLYWADLFVVELLKRCKSSTRERDYRPLLLNLVQDLLLVWIIPEYSIAEILLVTLIRRLTMDIAQASPQCLSALNSSPIDNSKVETTYLNAAFDCIGRIVNEQAKILSEQRAKPIQPTHEILPATTKMPNGFACYCGDATKDIIVVRCDACHRFYHGPCVDVLLHDAVSDDKWICDSCRLSQITKDLLSVAERKRTRQAMSLVYDDTYAVQHAFVSQLAAREGVSKIRELVQYQIARWADRLSHQPALNSEKEASKGTQPITQQAVMQILEYWDGKGPAEVTLTEQGTIRMILSNAALTSTFLLQFKSQVNNLLNLMNDDIHALRKLSLKAIEKLIEGDPNLMTQSNICKAVSRRLSDSQIAVREAALSLVGSYFTKLPVVADSFLPSLLICLNDVGVSVRKRCVKIFHELLLVSPYSPKHSQVCAALLSRYFDSREEDSVRDHILELFLQLWLGDNESFAQISKSDDKLITSGRSFVAAEQMVASVRVSGSIDHLEKLLRELVHGADDHDKGHKQAERNRRAVLARSQCDRLVGALFQLLLSIEERRNKEKSFSKCVASVLMTISIFAEISPTAVLRFVDSVFPYLKADNGVSSTEEAVIVTAVCDILHRLSTLCGSEIAIRAVTVSGDLQAAVWKLSPVAMEAAIRTLSILSLHQHESGQSDFLAKLFKLSNRFYTYLFQKHTANEMDDVKVRSNTHRALIALGFICNYRKIKVDEDLWEDEVVDDEPELTDPDSFDFEFFNSELLLLACYRMFRRYLEKNDPTIKCTALKALAGMFVSQPRLMLLLEQDDLIDDVMSQEADISVQLTALQCWRRILLGEEKRIDSGKAQYSMDSNTAITAADRISGDQDSDASLFGGILTNQADRLFQMTQSTQAPLRFAALELIGVLLQQGQLNPNDAVPYLFALQGDLEAPEIRQLGLLLLMNEGDKRPDVLRQRICAGVKRAFDFQRTLYPSKVVSALTDNCHGDEVFKTCLFSEVFKECMVRNRKQRLGLYENLLGFFDVSEADASDHTQELSFSGHQRRRSNLSSSVVKKRVIDVSLARFVSQILAYLPYEASGDPLFIIHKITTLIMLHGNTILDRFALLLRSVALIANDEVDWSHEEDVLERAGRSKFPSRTKEAMALTLTSSDFDLSTFSELCSNGTSLSLLLRLKTFLRQRYQLSESRIHEYDPTAKDSIVNRGIHKAKVKTLSFDDSAEETDARMSASGLDLLIRQYSEFRRLMRAEAASTTDAGGALLEDDSMRGAGAVDVDGMNKSKILPRMENKLCNLEENNMTTNPPVSCAVTPPSPTVKTASHHVYVID